jgi:hypothetical protein
MTVETDSAVDPGQATGRRRPWWSPGLADGLFIFLVVVVLQQARIAMLDDPGLGWHLRTADQMRESGGFLYQETFCGPTEGRPMVCRDWLGDILLRTAYGWGGLAGVAVLTSLVIALVLRLLYTGMVSDGVPWQVAIVWTLLATMGTEPSWMARPNVFSFLGLVLTVFIAERYHRGKLSARQTLWLLPIFLLWTNLHGGFIAGLVTLGVVYAVECGLALWAPEADQRIAARQRVRWLTVLGVGVGLATLINPYGIGLHRWNVQTLTDKFIQSSTTIEWLSPNFKLPGWFAIELLILLFPLLAATSRRKVSLVALVLGIVWLHFGLTGRRYTTLWTVVIVPTLAALSCGVPWVERFTGRLAEPAPAERRSLVRGRSPALATILFAGLMLAISPWLGWMVRHNPKNMPAAALDRFLQMYDGKTVFHSINWGGYLTWHGWDLQPRLKTWIDDRLDVHGKEHTQECFDIMAARSGWQERLDRYHVDWLCIPADSRLAERATETPEWKEVFREQTVVVFHRVEPSRPVAQSPSPEAQASRP